MKDDPTRSPPLASIEVELETLITKTVERAQEPLTESRGGQDE